MTGPYVYRLPPWQTVILRGSGFLALVGAPLLLIGMGMWLALGILVRGRPMDALLAGGILALLGIFMAVLNWWFVLYRSKNVATYKASITDEGLIYWPVFIPGARRIRWDDARRISLASVPLGRNTHRQLRIEFGERGRRIVLNEKLSDYEDLVRRVRAAAPQFSYEEETDRGLARLTLFGPVLGCALALFNIGFNAWRGELGFMSVGIWIVLLALQIGSVGWMLLVRERPKKRDTAARQ